MRRFFALFTALLFAAPAAAQVNIGANFQSMTVADVAGVNGGSFGVPPDTTGAIGPNHWVQYNNGGTTIFRKDGSVASAITNEATFWNGKAGIASGIANNASGDPRMLFDPLSGRWFAAAFTGENTNNNILIARSDTSDPTGTWKGVVRSQATGQFWDFPTLGVDKNGLYIGVNRFSGSFQGVTLLSIPKADILAATPTLANQATFSENGNTIGYTPQGVFNYNLGQGTGGTVYAVNSLNFSQVNVTPINNTGGAGATLGATTVVNVATTTFSPTGKQPNAAGSAQSARQLQTNDDRFGSHVYRVGNLLYGVHNVGSGGRAALRVTVLNATTNAVVAEATLAEGTFDLYFGSVVANARGDVVVGYTRSGFVSNGSANNRYPSAYASVGTLSGSTLTFPTQLQLRTGTTEYAAFDGSPHRWGDYSHTSLDPADPGIFWTTQEYVHTATQWGTQASEVIPTVSGEKRWASVASGSGANVNGVTGAFATAANWYNGSAPIATDHVIFSRNGDGTTAYTATLPAGTTTNDRASVRQGNVVWSIPAGATYGLTNNGTGATDTTANVNPTSLASLTVADYLGTANLTVSGGGTLSTQTTAIAARVNSEGTTAVSAGSLTVSGAGTTWTNAGVVYVGGNLTAAGGTGALAVTSGAAATVGGVVKQWNNASTLTVSGGGSLTATGGLTNPAGTTPTATVTGVGSLLRLNGTASPAYTGTINVGTGGKLDGSGGVNGAVNLNAGGILQGGTGGATTATNTLTLSAGLQLDGANTFRVAFADTNVGNGIADVTASRIALGAGVLSRNTGGAGSDLTTIRLVNTGATFDPGVSYTVVIATFGGTSNLALGNFTVDPVGEFFVFGNPVLSLSGTQLTVTFVPVPEPGSLLAVAGLGLAGWRAARRRRAA